MKSNDIVKKVYAAIIREAQKQVAAGQPGQVAAGIGTDVILIGQTWTTAIGDDGKVSDAEVVKMTDAFNAVVDRRIPSVENLGVTLLWRGFSLFGVGWKGLRHYLNKWFGLGLD